MENGKFFKHVYNMQNEPRWDEYAPRFEDDSASHSYRCAAFAVLAVLIEEKMFGNTNIDKTKAVGRALLHDMNETVTGSIKYSTKKDAIVAEHIKKLEKEASEMIVSYLSSSIQPIFKDYIVNAEDDSIEGRFVQEIDSFDALMLCIRESRYESNNYFEKKSKSIRNKLENSEFSSISYLTKAYFNNEKTEWKEFIKCIMDMSTLKRWKGSYNLVADNDATHTFRTSVIALFNALIEEYKYGRENISYFNLLGKVLYHDLIEAKTGDVIGPVKHSNPEIKRAFEEYEKTTSAVLIHKLPECLWEDLENFMIECKSDDFEGRMVDIADKMDAAIKAQFEMKHNSVKYANTYKTELLTIQRKFEEPSVIFFLAYPLHDLYCE